MEENTDVILNNLTKLNKSEGRPLGKGETVLMGRSRCEDKCYCGNGYLSETIRLILTPKGTKYIALDWNCTACIHKGVIRSKVSTSIQQSNPKGGA